MRFARVKGRVSYLVDEESGIEFFEKNVDERFNRFATEGWDTRLTSPVTFVFRDPTWIQSGGRDIELEAKALTRTARETYSDGRSYPYTQVYGFEIGSRAFTDSFRAYTAGDSAKLSHAKEFLTAALHIYMGKVEGKVVVFV